MSLSLDHLRRHAVARSLFAPTTLPAALRRLGFVQADPIRAPARAQDLTLRHRVRGYRAGDLERRYPRLDIEEDFFVNYGFMPRGLQQLMHPRSDYRAWPPATWARAQAVLAFVRERGVVHPREVDAAFSHGKSRNWFGGTSNASTQLLDGMHYRGLLRVARREGGTRVYAVSATHTPEQPSQQGKTKSAPREAEAAFDALVDVVLGKYAPLPLRSLRELITRITYGAPQWRGLRAAALQRALDRHPSAEVAGQVWCWVAGENPTSVRYEPSDTVRLLAPFDPVVWDRRRFEALWGWAYRFEAYVPAPQRVRGYYALPLLWRDRVIGWGNLGVQDARLVPDLGYVGDKPPRDAAFRRALEEELQRVSEFLAL